MTTDEALARLRPDWALSRDEDYRTEAPGWAVHSLMNGELYERLGWGTTIIEAIEAAEAKVEQEEREAAERWADYERRKAAGQLTPLEIASGRTAEIWGPAVLEAARVPSVFARLVDRSFEDEVTA